MILFGRNLESAQQVRALIGELRTLLPATVLWVDAEGGRVDRLEHVLAPAPAGEWLAAEPPAVARRAGRWIGHGLRALGFDADFAPVVDLDHGLRGNALDGRCLGGAPETVIPRARAFLDGLHGAGVGGCVKHFPGLGAAPADTHHHPATIELSSEALARELEPFRALAEKAGAVMVGHALYPAWDAERPASLSPEIVEGVLRRVYGQVPETVWPAARMSIRAQLDFQRMEPGQPVSLGAATVTAIVVAIDFVAATITMRPTPPPPPPPLP